MQQKKNAETQPEKIIIGMIPTGNPENLRKQALELAQQLQSTDQGNRNWAAGGDGTWQPSSGAALTTRLRPAQVGAAWTAFT